MKEQEYLREKIITRLNNIICDLSEQIKEKDAIISDLDFKIARRDVIIRFLSTGKADSNGEPIVRG